MSVLKVYEVELRTVELGQDRSWRHTLQFKPESIQLIRGVRRKQRPYRLRKDQKSSFDTLDKIGSAHNAIHPALIADHARRPFPGAKSEPSLCYQINQSPPQIKRAQNKTKWKS